MSETTRTRKLTDDSQGRDTDIVISPKGIKIKGEFVITNGEDGGSVIHTKGNLKDGITKATFGEDIHITSGTLDTKQI